MWTLADTRSEFLQLKRKLVRERKRNNINGYDIVKFYVLMLFVEAGFGA